jgi:hypothetical protein
MGGGGGQAQTRAEARGETREVTLEPCGRGWVVGAAGPGAARLRYHCTSEAHARFVAAVLGLAPHVVPPRAQVLLPKGAPLAPELPRF